jgi:hypothetical protein
MAALVALLVWAGAALAALWRLTMGLTVFGQSVRNTNNSHWSIENTGFLRLSESLFRPARVTRGEAHRARRQSGAAPLGLSSSEWAERSRSTSNRLGLEPP